MTPGKLILQLVILEKCLSLAELLLGGGINILRCRRRRPADSTLARKKQGCRRTQPHLLFG